MLEKRILAFAVTAATALSLSGCSHLPSMHWPWHRKPAPPPPEVHELVETSEAGAASPSFPQYWLRNTLIVDLKSASGSGSVVLTPREGTTWPVRIAFIVTPGAIGQLEIRADQRTVLPVTPSGTKPVYLELSPGVYEPKTPKITASWATGAVPPGAPAKDGGQG